MKHKRIIIIVLSCAVGVNLSMAWLTGCQSKKVSPDKRQPKVEISDNSNIVTVDDQTAQMLKQAAAEPHVTAGPAVETRPTEQATPLPEQLPAAEVETTPVLPKAIEAVTAGQPIPDEPAAPQEAPFEDVTNKMPVLANTDLADKLVSVNFEQADIRAVIKTVSDITGINFIIDEKITGTVTVLSPTKLRLDELYHFLESILEVKGFAAIPTGDHVKIVARADASKKNLLIRIGSDPAQIPQNDTIVTQIIPLKYANTGEIGTILTPRLPTSAEMAIYNRTNTIIITDTSANIYNLVKIIRQLDVPGAKEEHVIIPLKYASAQALSEQITEIMEQDTGRSQGGAKTSGAPSLSSTQIKADPRTNALVVVANKHDIEIIEGLVQQLDIERPVGAYNVYVVHLDNADAKETAESLSLAFTNLKGDEQGNVPPVKITQYEGTSSLIINASAQDYKVISEIISKLDIEREQVLVELFIVEVSEDSLQEIGVDWASLDGAVADNLRGFGQTDFGIRSNYTAGELGGLAIGAFREIGGNVKIGAILNALETDSNVNILSRPNILTSNHSKADILVGDNIPYVTQSRITESDPSTPTVIKTIDYKDVGVSMSITPHINHKQKVRLEISSEFTQVIDGVTGLSADTPTTATRKLNTVISIASGETVVIGGLIRDDKITTEQKIPLLGDIPIAGNLFKFKRDRLQKTNLLLFITPYVLSSQSDIDAITQKKKDAVTPELDQRLKDKNISDVDIFESIWR